MNTRAISQAVTIPLLIHNRRSKETLLILEPWAFKIVMPPGASFEIKMSDQMDIPEIEYADDRISVFANHLPTVFYNTAELRFWESDGSPFLPPDYRPNGKDETVTNGYTELASPASNVVGRSRRIQ